MVTLKKIFLMTFSGHDTFHCRLFWLKKGIDFLQKHEKFQEDSGIELGVGKNMVNSIKFWTKAFGAVDDNYNVKPLFKSLFDDKGWDPYLEDEGTLWLLHYHLCATNYSSIYHILFRDFRKVKQEFTKTALVNYILDLGLGTTQKIIEKDFSVFTRMYGSVKESYIDDGYTGILTELGLLREVGKSSEGKTLFRIENSKQQQIPNAILLTCILLNENYGQSISFTNLYNDENGIGNIFCLDRDILEQKLIEIAQNFSGITYNSEAGIKELQFQEGYNSVEVLKQYYNE